MSNPTFTLVNRFCEKKLKKIPEDIHLLPNMEDEEGTFTQHFLLKFEGADMKRLIIFNPGGKAGKTTRYYLEQP